MSLTLLPITPNPNATQVAISLILINSIFSNSLILDKIKNKRLKRLYRLVIIVS